MINSALTCDNNFRIYSMSKSIYLEVPPSVFWETKLGDLLTLSSFTVVRDAHGLNSVTSNLNLVFLSNYC